MRAYGITDSGLGRETNEDTIFLNPRLGLFMVADGMGGHERGDLASRMAVETVNGYLEKAMHQRPTGPEDRLDEVIRLVGRGIDQANRRIFESSRLLPGKPTIGTTLALVLTLGPKMVLSHIGDSRIYRLQNGALEKMTRDHTRVQEMVDQGLLSRGQAEGHSLGHLLTRALGARETVEADLQVIETRGEDCFLLASDGLSSVVSDLEIEKVLASKDSTREKCRALVQRTLEAGAPDNISVIVLEPKTKGIFRRIFPAR